MILAAFFLPLRFLIDEMQSMVQNYSMFEQRNHIRFKALAKVKIEETSINEALLNDLSITGCQVECTSYAELKLNKQYKLEIIPESDAKIGTFELLVELMWLHTEGYSCEVGFAILESPKGKLFERYVDYLSWRYFHGSSITKNGASESSPAEKA